MRDAEATIQGAPQERRAVSNGKKKTSRIKQPASRKRNGAQERGGGEGKVNLGRLAQGEINIGVGEGGG